MTPRAVAAAALAALLLASVGCSSWQGARLYQTGTAALDRGDAERAVSDLEQAAALASRASEVQNHLGLAYAALGRDDEAVRAFERAVELDCDNTAARQNLRGARRSAHTTRKPGP